MVMCKRAGRPFMLCFFFFNDTATTEIYTLSLHDALPIWPPTAPRRCAASSSARWTRTRSSSTSDRKSTRLNSSHLVISYAVFCLKKKKHHSGTLPAVSSAVSALLLAIVGLDDPTHALCVN